jgi:lipid-binding SYLF domain-containing protein
MLKKGEWEMKGQSRIKQNTKRGSLQWKALTVFLMLAFCAGLGLNGEAVAKEPSKKEQQAEIRKMANETLSRLYKAQPSARKVVGRSAGYAVFSNFGMKIFVMGSGKGEGIVINKKNNKETFMKMFEAQAGLGIGAKKFRQVWVFKSQKALNGFVNSGWEFGGQATAAEKTGEKGGDLAGAIAVDVDILVYQLTDDGLAAEITAKGTKYYKDKDLN